MGNGRKHMSDVKYPGLVSDILTDGEWHDISFFKMDGQRARGWLTQELTVAQVVKLLPPLGGETRKVGRKTEFRIPLDKVGKSPRINLDDAFKLGYAL